MSKPSRKRRERAKDDVDGPAVVTALHRRDRPATNGDGKPIIGSSAWRKLSPLEAAFGKRQLEGGIGQYGAAERYSAGMAYSAIFDAAESPGKDSTQALNAIRGGSGGSPGMAQAKASSELACIHSHMGHRDRQIIELVCGYGHTPPRAINAVMGEEYEKAALARFRESLDALCDAIETSRRRPGEIDMRIRA